MKTTQFHAFEGSLWRDDKIIRQNWNKTFARIQTVEQFKSTLRAGQFAWPGGYPMFLICSDGEALCFDCAKGNFRYIAQSIRHGLDDGWCIVGCAVNWEDTDLYCAHCNKQIESAYGE